MEHRCTKDTGAEETTCRLNVTTIDMMTDSIALHTTRTHPVGTRLSYIPPNDTHNTSSQEVVSTYRPGRARDITIGKTQRLVSWMLPDDTEGLTSDTQTRFTDNKTCMNDTVRATRVDLKASGITILIMDLTTREK